MMSMQTIENPQDEPEAPRIDPKSLARSVAMTVADEPDQVGRLTRSIDEDDHVTDFRFESKKRGYEGWEWSVTLYHDTDIDEWTVNESSLVPTDQALMPPAWVPWKDRLLPTDLSVTDSIGTEPDDSRLEDGFRRTEPSAAAPTPDADQAQAKEQGEDGRTQAEDDVSVQTGDTTDNPEDASVTSAQDLEDSVEEFMLSRRHVLSPLGRDQTAKRWYEGPHGPKALSTKTAAGNLCSTCGFFVPLKGDFDRMFGVCANKWSPDDGRVVSLDHGCGEHSEIDPPQPSHLWVQSKPAYDDMHIDVIAQSPREERSQVELLEEASEVDIDNNTVEDDETDSEERDDTQQTPQVESVITMDDLEAAGFPETDHGDDGDDDDDADAADDTADTAEAAGNADTARNAENTDAGDVAQAAEVAPSDGRKQTDDTETSDDAAETGNAKSAAYGDTANPTDAPGADGNGGNPQSAD
jgi:hypothetical protein